MTPAVIAAGVAADIRKYGHYQGSRPTLNDKSCCVILSPTSARARAYENAAWYKFCAKVKDVIGSTGITFWNDRAPTETVLAVLDRIAAS